MQMRPGGIAGAAHITDGLSLFDHVAGLYNDFAHMSVAGGISAAVVDVRAKAVAAPPSRFEPQG